MKVYFVEDWLDGLYLGVQIESVVYTTRTKFQELAIFDTCEFGRMLTLDNVIQVTEVDEYIYHECIAHVPLLSYPDPKKVLLIGGGDGGTLREITRHQNIESITMVDIDEGVIEASKKYLPGFNQGFYDPRLNLVIQDGSVFVSETEERFDVIIIDSTDPEGPGEVLFTTEFYQSLRRLLTPSGIMCAQTESPLVMTQTVKDIYHRIADVFPITKIFNVPMACYPGGWWCFTCGSLGPDPEKPLREPEESWNLKFYSPEVHEKVFILGPKLKRDLGIRE